VEAVPWLRKALTAKPHSPAYLNNLAVALFELGQHTEAMSLWDQASRYRPQVATVKANLDSIAAFRNGTAAKVNLHYIVVIQP
jgi:Flp pilus assembly protein TadD